MEASVWSRKRALLYLSSGDQGHKGVAVSIPGTVALRVALLCLGETLSRTAVYSRKEGGGPWEVIKEAQFRYGGSCGAYSAQPQAIVEECRKAV